MGIKGQSVSQYISGMPVAIKECNIAVTQPKVKEILQLGEENFLRAVQLFQSADEMAENLLKNVAKNELGPISNFQILLMLIKNTKELSEYITLLFELIFPNYDYEITNNEINFFNKEENNKQIIGRVTPFSFDSFKHILSEMFLPKLGSDEGNYNPEGEKAKEIAEKLKAGARRRAEMKSRQDGEDPEQSIFSKQLSILSIGLGMDINTLLMYTPFQLYDAFERFMLKTSYDFYCRIITIPFADTSKMDEPEEWTKNLYN